MYAPDPQLFSMPTARYWDGWRLALAWLAVSVAFLTVRWSLLAGVYQFSIENQRITRLGGLWTPSFAVGMTRMAAVIMALSLLWATGTWIAGRRDRRVKLDVESEGHRKVLM